MLKDILAGLSSLIVTIKENLIASCVAIVLILLLILMTNNNSNVLSSIAERNPSPATEQIRFNRSLEVNDEINTSIEQLRERMHGDRVLIRQFHNGKYDLSGIPFTSITTTFVALKPGVTLDVTAFNSYPISSMNRTLKNMWTRPDERKCIIEYTNDITDPVYKSYLVSNGVYKYASCPLTNLLDYPIGIIGVGYLSNNKEVKDEVILSELEEMSVKVSGYLGVIKGDEELKKQKNLWNLWGLIQP